MLLLIPLGGIGSRFKKNGYSMPKALIKVFGKPIIFWLLDTLNIPYDTIVYIPYNKEYEKYRFESLLRKKYPMITFKFHMLENDTRGAAETINIALSQLNIDDQPIVSFDSDNFYLTDVLSLWNGENSVVCFDDCQNQAIYSYVKCDNDKVIDIVEKEKISDNACCGGYAFSSFKQLQAYTQYIIDNDIRQKEEFYTSTVIKEMLQDDHKFNMIKIKKEEFVCLGTPIQLKFFYNNYPKNSCFTMLNKIKTMRFCFDLDNTLVTFPKIKNDYTSVEPIEKNINFLRYLKSFGHTIIIHTARRMKTHHGNIGKIMSDVGKITFDTLLKYDIPYDEIYFGKPYADIYIDDLGLNCFSDLDKELGFYMDQIQPRDFNQLERNTIDIYTKYSNDLSGEIYYYNNIPKSVKDMFPIMFDYDANKNTWYKIEQIKGLTCSTLYNSELLTKTTLHSIMASLNRLHDLNIEDGEDVNIYKNYSEKMELRYNSYNYSRFKDYEKTYGEILSFLKDYEANQKGKKVVIHGDTVLTNIMINEFDKIKFIDMRGKVGDTLTICGDWLYDWAKLYQSLIGYDTILMDKVVSPDYKNEMLAIFEEYFMSNHTKEDFSNMKMITKSLLLTLIPIHNNEKCQEYYNLISKI
jgi:capsule biosynthesis phosphatase